MKRTHLFYGKSMATNFPGLPHSIGFADFSNPTYYGESVSKNFPGSPHSMLFVGYYWETISQV